MQDHASHWTHLAPHDAPLKESSRRAPRSFHLRNLLKRSAGRRASSTMFTGAILLAGTLCAAGTFVYMLPITGRSAPYPRQALVESAPASTAPIVSASNPRPESFTLPRMVTSLAFVAGETLARVEQHHDVAAAIRTGAPAPYAAAGVVAPDSDRVVYLVDASGSLVDSLPRVIEWLGDSLDGLERRQRFTVLFFRKGQVFEVPPAGLKKASFASKATAWSWMQPDAGNVLPQGRSDLGRALQAAVAYHPREIVLLSDDSLAKRGSGDESILRDVADSLHGRDVTIHTVQFFYRDQAGALEAIADRFGGQYDFIAPARPDPSSPDIDPLLAPLVN